jgi:hypothetical protein
MSFKSDLISTLKDGKYFIKDGNDEIIGYLAPVSEDDLNNPLVIEKITSWRVKYLNSFLSVFEPTVESTYEWLKNTLIPNPNRVLFKIFTPDNRFVGHIGAIKCDEYIEYDYFIRGEKVDKDNFSLITAKRFLRWISETTGIRIIKGNVRSDNTSALNFHLRTGFKINKKLPLIKNFTNGMNYNLVVSETEKFPDLYLIEIITESEDLIL